MNLPKRFFAGVILFLFLICITSKISYSQLQYPILLPSGNSFDFFLGTSNYPGWTGFNLTEDYGGDGKIFIGIRPDRPVNDVFGIMDMWPGHPEYNMKLSLKSDGGAFFKGKVDLLNNLTLTKKASTPSINPSLEFAYDSEFGINKSSFKYEITSPGTLLMKRLTNNFMEFPVMSFYENNEISGETFIGIGKTTPSSMFDINGSLSSFSLSTGTATLGATTINGNTAIQGALNISNGIISNYSDLSSYPLRFKTTNSDDWGIMQTTQNYGDAGEFYGMGLKIRDDGMNGFFIKDNASGNYRMVIRHGKIGIGTDDPHQTLDINGTINATEILRNGQQLNTSQWTTSGSSIYYNAGNIGIGTTNPILPLHISTGMQIGTSTTANQNFHWVAHDWSGIWGLRLYSGNNGAGTHLMTITNNGNIGIGTPTPDANYKLSVNGHVRAKEIKVEANWSDFVFKPDYHLMSLSDVEKYIQENGHLEGIPTEQEVNENGVDLGVTSSKLLQKIEELTLYVIEQNKRIEKLEKENENLKSIK